MNGRSDNDSWDITTGVGSTALFVAAARALEAQHKAGQWFSRRGWTVAAVPLSDYLRTLGRPVPAEESEVAGMITSITLVSAVKN